MGDLVALFKQLPSEAEPLVLELTGRIGKLRALDDDESRLLEEAIRREQRRTWQERGSQRHIWTPQEDKLLLHSSSYCELKRTAELIGVTFRSAEGRLERLRKKRAGQQQLERVG